MKQILAELQKLAKDKQLENKKFLDKLKKKTPKNLDYVMQELHEAEFKRTDCLNCANCCKTTGPLFTSADIERIASRIALLSARPRDLTGLRAGLQQLPAISAALSGNSLSHLLSEISETLKTSPDCLNFLTQAIAEDPSSVVRDGGVISKGFHA